jgi:hypothetical protein
MSNEKMYIDVSDIFKVSDTLYHSTKIVKQPLIFIFMLKIQTIGVFFHALVACVLYLLVFLLFSVSLDAQSPAVFENDSEVANREMRNKIDKPEGSCSKRDNMFVCNIESLSITMVYGRGKFEQGKNGKIRKGIYTFGSTWYHCDEYIMVVDNNKISILTDYTNESIKREAYAHYGKYSLRKYIVYRRLLHRDKHRINLIL